MAEQRATGPASMADERHEQRTQRRALREARAGDRERSENERGEYERGRADARARAPRRAHPAGTARRAGRRVQRSAAAPVTGLAIGAAGIVGTMLALVGLYLVLTSAETVDDVVRLVRHGIRWLASPAHSIPYGDDRKEG